MGCFQEGGVGSPGQCPVFFHLTEDTPHYEGPGGAPADVGGRGRKCCGNREPASLDSSLGFWGASDLRCCPRRPQDPESGTPADAEGQAGGPRTPLSAPSPLGTPSPQLGDAGCVGGCVGSSSSAQAARCRETALEGGSSAARAGPRVRTPALWGPAHSPCYYSVRICEYISVAKASLLKTDFFRQRLTDRQPHTQWGPGSNLGGTHVKAAAPSRQPV